MAVEVRFVENEEEIPEPDDRGEGWDDTAGLHDPVTYDPYAWWGAA